MVKSAMWGLILAVQFLTRIPIPIQAPWQPAAIRWALRFYPFVGLCISAFLCLMVILLQPFLPVWMLTLLVISAWVGLTGGLHLDGWMDVADAVGSNASLDRKWMIMKDPHVGSLAVIALLVLLVWKGSFLFHVLNDPNFFSLLLFLFVPMLARWGVVFLLWRCPTEKQEGLAWEWKKYMTVTDVWLASFVMLLPVLVAFIFCSFIWQMGLLFMGSVSLLIVGSLLFIGVYTYWVLRTFKGVNGDLSGAAIEGGELWLLSILWIWFWFGMA